MENALEYIFVDWKGMSRRNIIKQCDTGTVVCVLYIYSILYNIVYLPPCSTLCLPTLKYLFHLHICLCLNDILQKYNTKYIDRQIDCVILYLSYVYRTHINICMCETFSAFRIESTIILPKYIYMHIYKMSTNNEE